MNLGTCHFVHTLNPEIIDLYISPNYGVAPFPEIDLTMDGTIDLEDINSALGSYPIVQSYYYSPFGEVWQGEKANDTNSFRYAGEYHDAETGSIYLRARYYNPSTGRFITVDPIKDGTNWYVYCSNNPIMFVDPWGLAIILPDYTGEDDPRFVALQELTDDTLYVDPETGEVSYTECENVEREVATNLVREVINNDEWSVDIIITNETTRVTSGMSKDGTIKNICIEFNPECEPVLWSYVEGEGYKETTLPAFLVLGHELIHVVRRMNNVSPSYTYAYYLSGRPLPLLKCALVEELETVGINYYVSTGYNFDQEQYDPNRLLAYYSIGFIKVECSQNYYTENALRAEYDNYRKGDPNYSPVGRRCVY